MYVSGDIKKVMQQMFEGLFFIHNNKIIHRDLKLGNVFLNDNLECKIGAFGLATKVDYDGERKKTLCGTPNYIAPEMVHFKHELGAHTDIYLLGATLHQVLTMDHRHPGQTLKAVLGSAILKSHMSSLKCFMCLLNCNR